MHRHLLFGEEGVLQQITDTAVLDIGGVLNYGKMFLTKSLGWFRLCSTRRDPTRFAITAQLLLELRKRMYIIY